MVWQEAALCQTGSEAPPRTDGAGAPGRRYPRPMMDAASYTAHERTREGAPFSIRAIRPDDKERLLENFGRLSERTVYYRFMEPKHELTAADLRHLTEPDFDSHVALVAVAPDEEDGHERILGVGRYYTGTTPSGDLVAEVAFAVDDAFQGQGIGTHLLHHLGTVAMARGIRHFEAFVHPDNRRMLEVFQNSGYGVREQADTDLVHVQMDLEESPETRRRTVQADRLQQPRTRAASSKSSGRT